MANFTLPLILPTLHSIIILSFSLLPLVSLLSFSLFILNLSSSMLYLFRMKKLIVRLLGTTLSFYITNFLVIGFHIEPNLTTYLVASLVFILINTILKPIIKLILLPINLITLGLFYWLINVIVLYIFDFLYDGVTITAYQFPGFHSSTFNLPPMHLSLFWTLVISSFLISFFYSIYEIIFR